MEIFELGIVLVTEVMKLRAQYFAAASPEKQRELADKYADSEIQWLTWLESLRPKP